MALEDLARTQSYEKETRRTEKERSVYLQMITPCVNRCKLDEDSKICLGCKRTVREITDWSQMTDEQRIKIIKELKHR